jgi:hypothetical protein
MMKELVDLINSIYYSGLTAIYNRIYRLSTNSHEYNKIVIQEYFTKYFDYSSYIAVRKTDSGIVLKNIRYYIKHHYYEDLRNLHVDKHEEFKRLLCGINGNCEKALAKINHSIFSPSPLFFPFKISDGLAIKFGLVDDIVKLSIDYIFHYFHEDKCKVKVYTDSLSFDHDYIIERFTLREPVMLKDINGGEYIIVSLQNMCYILTNLQNMKLIDLEDIYSPMKIRKLSRTEKRIHKHCYLKT